MFDAEKGIVKYEFNKDQIDSLNDYQKSGNFHPFTCKNHGDENHGKNDYLVATASGWICPYCEYKQDWAHSFMADYSWDMPKAEQSKHVRVGVRY